MRLDLTRPVTAGLAAFAVAEATAVWAVLKPNAPAGAAHHEDQVQTLPYVIAFIAVTALIVFGLVARLRRTNDNGTPAQRRLLTGAYTCALLGLLLVLPAFWSGLPILLGTAAVALAGAATVPAGVRRTTARIAIAPAPLP